MLLHRSVVRHSLTANDDHRSDLGESSLDEASRSAGVGDT